MAVPWQTDTASCRSGYDKSYDPYTPTFWPARVPNQVLTKENYDIVMDAKRSLAERRAAFANRAAWVTPLGTTSYTDQINNMILHFDHLGVVEQREGPKDKDFPQVVEVEDQHEPIKDLIKKDEKELGRTMVAAPSASHGAKLPRKEAVDLTIIEKVRRFPGGLTPRTE
jgi:hypothetical protein